MNLTYIKKPMNYNTPANNDMFKVTSRNTRTRCEIYSKLKMKMVYLLLKFEYVSHFSLADI